MDILRKLVALEKEAEDFGFRWHEVQQIMEQIQSECLEIQEHLPATTSKEKIKLQEEIGDLMHAVFSLCVFCHFDPRQTLENTIDKFATRLNNVKSIAAQQGLTNLNHLSFKELMVIWEKAKKQNHLL